MDILSVSVLLYYISLFHFNKLAPKLQSIGNSDLFSYGQTQVLRRLLWRSSYLHNDWKSMHLCNSAQMRTVANQAQRSQILRSFNNVCLKIEGENHGKTQFQWIMIMFSIKIAFHTNQCLVSHSKSA